MMEQCISCKIEHEDKALNNVRGDIDLEGYIILQFPEALKINENDPIKVCSNCEKELRDRNNNSQRVVNRSNNRSRNVHDLSIIGESEDIQIASQSLSAHIEPPLSISVENTPVPPTFDLEKLKKPGEVEKLTKNPKVQRKLRNLIIQSMPAAAKKRKLSEMLGNNFNVDSSQSSSNSESETVIERSPTQPQQPKQLNNEELATDFLRYYMSQPGRLNRSYQQSISSSQTQQVSPSQSLDAELSVSSLEIIQPPLVGVSRSPVKPQQPQKRKSPPLAVLYDHDSSSDSDRVRNASSESDTGSVRRGAKRVALRNPSESSSNDEEEAARRQSAERQARRASAERRAAQENAVRQRQENDGNNHSNLAAPRRINLDQPTASRRQINTKDTYGG